MVVNHVPATSMSIHQDTNHSDQKRSSNNLEKKVEVNSVVLNLIEKWNGNTSLFCDDLSLVKILCACARNAASSPIRGCLVEALVLTSYANLRLSSLQLGPSSTTTTTTTSSSSQFQQREMQYKIEKAIESESKVGLDFGLFTNTTEFDWMLKPSLEDDVLLCLDPWRLVAIHINSYLSDDYLESSHISEHHKYGKPVSEVLVMSDLAILLRKPPKKADTENASSTTSEIQSAQTQAVDIVLEAEDHDDNETGVWLQTEDIAPVVNLDHFPLLCAALDKNNTVMDLLLLFSNQKYLDIVSSPVSKSSPELLEAELKSLLRCMGMFRLYWHRCEGFRLAKLELLCRLLADVALKADLCLTNKMLAAYDNHGGAGSGSSGSSGGGLQLKSQKSSDDEMSFTSLRNQLKQFALLLKRLLTLDDHDGLDGYINFKKIMDCSVIDKHHGTDMKIITNSNMVDDATAVEELSHSAPHWVFKIIFPECSHEFHQRVYQGPSPILANQRGGEEAANVAVLSTSYNIAVDRSSQWLESSEIASSIQGRLSKLARFCHNFNKTNNESITTVGVPNQSLIHRLFMEQALAQARSDAELHVNDDADEMG
jgi:hypothetical protein